MRVTTIHGPRDIRLEERPVPTIEAPTDAIIKVTAGCICGSDLWPYRGENDITPGDTIGHEMIGVVEEVGSEVTSFRPGDFVIAPFCHSDNTCPNCLAGVTSACVNFGITTGGQGEYAKVTQAEGSLVLGASRGRDARRPTCCPRCSPSPTCSRPAGTAPSPRGVQPGDTAVVVGDGAVGLCAVLAAVADGCRAGHRDVAARPTARSSPASSAPPTSWRSVGRKAPRGSRSSPPVSARTPCSSASAPTARCGRPSRVPDPARPSASSASRTVSSCRCRGCSARTSGSPAGWLRCARYLPDPARAGHLRHRRPRARLRHAAAARRGRRGLPGDGRARAPSRSTSMSDA